jgi:hypothetical protein
MRIKKARKTVRFRATELDQAAVLTVMTWRPL